MWTCEDYKYFFKWTGYQPWPQLLPLLFFRQRKRMLRPELYKPWKTFAESKWRPLLQMSQALPLIYLWPHSTCLLFKSLPRCVISVKYQMTIISHTSSFNQFPYLKRTSIKFRVNRLCKFEFVNCLNSFFLVEIHLFDLRALTNGWLLRQCYIVWFKLRLYFITEDEGPVVYYN